MVDAAAVATVVLAVVPQQLEQPLPDVEDNEVAYRPLVLLHRMHQLRKARQEHLPELLRLALELRQAVAVMAEGAPRCRSVFLRKPGSIWLE